ncbi:PREDICTED: CD2 antigen cytoplasmic tail-binding protein 2 [Camelina sativa]|uniref:CD2 antigen cytoplasmic tail-binding protein 2 n=1 Tax=Camelina sativa TaxID=90675 RepID=A0ABM0T9Q6_CAMSA|nr:PREDICTED: CD2 antigen cytoplasmic tail-binding protein 2 [Camelina sativa]
MAESSSRKNLKRSFLEDEESDKQPPEKRVRFPKGKKSKPEQILGEEAIARRDAREAAEERARHRNQNTAQLFNDNEDDNDNIDEAQETYENDGNRTEDGIQIEAFSLDREKEEGYFDADGNFVEYVREKEVKDAWLDSIEKNPLYMGRSAANDTEKDEDSGNEKAVDELSQEDIGVRKRRIANVLEPGETVLRALRRLKGNSNNRKEKMTPETKLIFDQLTEDADKLIQNGDYNVYHEEQDVFQREAEGYERLAQARGNTESCDMFGDDESAPDPSSDLQSGSISGTQLNPTNNGSDYVYDESSGYYYSSSLGYYYDPNTGLYCSGTTGKWYKYDEETKEYEEVVSEVATGEV